MIAKGPFFKVSAPLPQDACYGVLFSKRTGLIKPGLERVIRARDLLGTKDSPCTIHVGGTNGKGTTAAWLDRLLGLMGAKTGLYTSPHLTHFRERYCVAGAMATDAELQGIWRRLEARLPAALFDELSFFELGTLIAWELFHEHHVDTSILEVGMGGRWDTTNAATGQVVVLTNVGLDHQDFLGDTIAKIAGEKAGLIKPNRPIVWGGHQDSDADAVITRVAKEKGAQLVRVGAEPGPQMDAWLEGQTLVVGNNLPWTGRYELPEANLPRYLAHNRALALIAAFFWTREKKLHDPVALVRQALEKWRIAPPPTRPCEWGRFQKLAWPGRQGPTLLDVAHNPHGMAALVAALSADEPWHVRLAVLADKDLSSMISLLTPMARSLGLVASPQTERGRVEPWPGLDFYESWEQAVASVPPGDPLLISGSVMALASLHQQNRLEDAIRR